jgi:predicted dehydrogenase
MPLPGCAATLIGHAYQWELPRSAVDLRMDRAPPGNGHYTDTDTHALDLLRHILGAKVITTYEHGRAPLPDTGPCSRCSATTTRYGRNGSPLCADCRAARPALP